MRVRSASVPFAAASYITAAYWFTASTSFANPAVTLARVRDGHVRWDPTLRCARVHHRAVVRSGRRHLKAPVVGIGACPGWEPTRTSAPRPGAVPGHAGRPQGLRGAEDMRRRFSTTSPDSPRQSRWNTRRPTRLARRLCTW